MDTSNVEFSAVDRVYGKQNRIRLANAHVCVVGIGGVGSWVVEALVRSGIGQLTIIDPDDIAASNINRQIHADTSTVERSKVEVMRERVELINPECVCHAIDDMLVPKNIETYIGDHFDYVVDAMDSILFKAALINHCKRNKIPIITIGGAGGRTDPSKIEIAAKVRHRLRAKHGFRGRKRIRVECVFSYEQARYPTAEGDISYKKPGSKGITLDCDTGYGSLVSVTASFGFMAAARVLKFVCEI